LLLCRLCGRKGGSTQARDIGELLQLRQHMGHLIGNLQVYLQLDVIESNYDWLLGQLAAAQVRQIRKVECWQPCCDHFCHATRLSVDSTLIYTYTVRKCRQNTPAEQASTTLTSVGAQGGMCHSVCQQRVVDTPQLLNAKTWSAMCV
jgi:hypothetical protein